MLGKKTNIRIDDDITIANQCKWALHSIVGPDPTFIESFNNSELGYPVHPLSLELVIEKNCKEVFNGCVDNGDAAKLNKRLFRPRALLDDYTRLAANFRPRLFVSG